MGALIWLASYPKSGNTWMRSFLHNLFRNTPEPVDINEITDFCLGESAARWYERHASGPLNGLKAEEIAGVTGPLGFFDPLGFSADTPAGKLLFYREVGKFL